MKLFDRSTEVESIDIKYKNGKRYSIWIPKEVNIALKLVVDEDEEVEEHDEDGLLCAFDIHGQALWDNINTIEE
jgi:hypothetical protein